ncbi:hypothetical protein ACFLS9_09945 [Bacteroidota bacterium]
MKKYLLSVLIIIIFAGFTYPQLSDSVKQNEIFWKITKDKSIKWDLVNETRLPHVDNIEMSGQKVAAIVSYNVDENKILEITRDIIFPQLRVFIKSSESSWRNYRAYLRDEYGDQVLPKIIVEDRTFEAGPLDSIKINGMLYLYHGKTQGLITTRTLMPSMTERLFIEKWTITNVTDTIKQLDFGKTEFRQEQTGVKGIYKRKIYCDALENVTLKPSDSYEFAVYFTAYLNDEPELKISYKDVIAERNSFLNIIQNNLLLESPDTVLNTLFCFSKIRAAESIYQTKMGLVHSPGGGRYYTGVWANDQAEYSGPFFPYLGYDIGNQAAMNAYVMFKKKHTGR